MFIRGKRVPQQRQKPPSAQHKPFLSPTRGWVSGTNLAAGPDGSAQVLENLIPTKTGIKMRSGSQKHATCVAAQPLESSFTYVSGSTKRMFGACNGKVFDITSVADPDVPPAAAISGLTANYWSAINMATSGGNFLLIANGVDNMRKYDGAAWSSIAMGVGAGQIANVDSSAISQLNVYSNRVWMVEDGTMNAWYLPTDSIAGAATRVALSGVFRKGGALLFIATWSSDSGDGFDDRIVFVSTEGEVAVYQGDPALSNWAKVGRYDAAKPLGKNAFETFGGDLVILTDLGMLPLSAITTKDPSVLALAALSVNIQPDWNTDAKARRGLPWEIAKWTSHNLVFITCPVTGTESQTPPWCYGYNIETGAWFKVTGWNTRCIVVHDDWVYFGTNDGTMIQTEITGADDGELISYLYVGQYDHLGDVGRTKTVKQARAVFRARFPFIPQLAVTVDYTVDLPAYPNASSVTDNPGEWDVGLWDSAKWDTGLETFTSRSYWVSIGETGEAHAPVLQITGGGDIPAGAELVLFEVMYEMGSYGG